MDDNHAPGNPSFSQRILSFALIAAAVVGVGLAAYVVIRNTRRIEAVKPMVTFDKPTPEQELKSFKAGMRRRLNRLSRRFEKFRASSDTLTPEQSALAALCDSGFAQVRRMYGSFDSITDPRRAEAPKRELLNEYRELLGNVSRFSKTFRAIDAPEFDSLDNELLRILGEQ